MSKGSYRMPGETQRGKDMMRTSRLLSAFFCFLIFLTGVALAQTAEITRNINLRSDSSTANPPIRLLTPPAQVDLLEPDKTAGYFHVRTSANEEGWVWARNVRILETPPTPTHIPSPGTTSTAVPAAAATPTPTSVPAGPASAIGETWDKPASQEITYTTVHGSCGLAGKPGSDAATNLLKNRVDAPSAYHEVTFDAIAMLTYPSDAKSRASWTPAHLADIARFESVPVSVVGYLSHDVKIEGKESTNCGYAHPDPTTEVDWHMYLTKDPARPIGEAVIVETTPRVRKDRHWNRTTLLQWKDSTNQVRISGWLMLDPEHADMVGSARGTIWEVHPITKIEVRKNGAWIDLESLP